MKVIVLVLICLLAACSSIESVVESDYSYQGNFSKYKSFDFARNSSFKGSEIEGEVVQKYLKNTLTSWGYDQLERKPDLLVFYSVYYDDLQFQGFRQPEFKGWLRAKYSEREVVFKADTLDDGAMEETIEQGQRVEGEKYNPVIYSLRQGTLLISLFDRKKRKVVWQGYASGVFGENQNKNERIMRSAVIRILDEYKLLAFGAT